MVYPIIKLALFVHDLKVVRLQPFYTPSTRNGKRSTYRISPDCTVCMHNTYQGTP